MSTETFTHDPADVATDILGADQAPHGGAPAVTLESVNAKLDELNRRIDYVARNLGGLVEFVNIIKGMGAAAAKGGGVQAALLRQMVPGIENMAG